MENIIILINKILIISINYRRNKDDKERDPKYFTKDGLLSIIYHTARLNNPNRK